MHVKGNRPQEPCLVGDAIEDVPAKKCRFAGRDRSLGDVMINHPRMALHGRDSSQVMPIRKIIAPAKPGKMQTCIVFPPLLPVERKTAAHPFPTLPPPSTPYSNPMKPSSSHIFAHRSQWLQARSLPPLTPQSLLLPPPRAPSPTARPPPRNPRAPPLPSPHYPRWPLLCQRHQPRKPSPPPTHLSQRHRHPTCPLGRHLFAPLKPCQDLSRIPRRLRWAR